ncbi:polynucleotide kinase [Streptomyces phage Bmoc]|uniref:Polynucleotide kinase n=1 Tax=Streptomyces phage Bmoc TaxID=2725629 RepID=A0A6M3TAS8_9CAUD|nr:polynucleotide kinase [Streptomyces phage Bmoc]QJD50914.1 polynucleotide kinase [Streptomyces phage Bmoc]
MAQLLILRGVPGCGKSTFAHQWLKEGERRARVNRDDIRMQFFGKETGVDEDMVTKIEHMQVDSLLKAGYSVVVDDTNIRHKYITEFVKIGMRHGIYASVKQFAVDVETAIEQNRKRAAAGGRNVPEHVIRKMHQSMKSSGLYKYSSALEDARAVKPYIRPEGAEKVYLFDIDGTLAAMSDRSPFDWSRVGDDDPRKQVILTAQALAKAGYKIIVMSGRDGSCRNETIKWLQFYDVPFHVLFMRAEGDMRKDSIVKQELFDKLIRDTYDVVAVFDDRNQVVEMWRAMGVDCFQVAPGDF